MAKRKRKNRQGGVQRTAGGGNAGTGKTTPQATASVSHISNPGRKTAMSGKVRLSQCMIVKNEERNIEKALSWGKGIVCEQIVVDTGSADRTVEIAESMGAKVFHFEWINDFAAAKNYAIDQATGDWIAMLDADEYFEKEDASRILPMLEYIMSDPKMSKEYLAICSPMIQLGDEGQPMEIYEQERLFRNIPAVRYFRKIHERLTVEEKNIAYTTDFRVVHTGYTGDAFLKTGKAKRNIELLREELKADPDNPATKIYLAEALRADSVVSKKSASLSDEDLRNIEAIEAETEALYREVLDKGFDNVPPLLEKSTYEYFLRKYTKSEAIDPETEAICGRAHRRFPDDYKFMCYYALSLNKRKQHREAFDILKKCEEKLNAAAGGKSVLTTQIMGLFAAQMVLAAQGLGDTVSVLQYAEVLLLMDKTSMGTLQPYIVTLMQNSNTLDEVLGRLANVYDLTDQRDLLLLARAAKECGALGLAKAIIDYIGNMSGAANE